MTTGCVCVNLRRGKITGTARSCGLPCKPRFRLECIEQWLQGEAERGACHVWGESEKGECAGRERSCGCFPASTAST